MAQNDHTAAADPAGVRGAARPISVVREVEQPVINITLQADERRVFNVAEVAAILGFGRSKFYEIIAAGEIRTIHIGRLCQGTGRGH